MAWSHLVKGRAVLVLQTLGTLSVPAVLRSPAASDKVWTQGVSVAPPD